MKLQLPTVQTEASAQFTTESFGIGDPVVIMNILRSKMYSRPIYTVCQEIMSNARDAHREVGKPDLPIEIQLPTQLAPSFHVKDFGPGITPERMADIFIKYGNSTKRSDNKQTGGFGLGAKSPFSYTDTFTVVSNTPTDGRMMRREYVAYIDESQLGAMSLVKEEPTDEPQGTTVIVPAKPDDFSEFRHGVYKVGFYWEPHPKILGDKLKWEPVKTLFSGQGWEIQALADPQADSRANGFEFWNPLVLLDKIPYPIKMEALYRGRTPDEIRDLSTRALRLHFGVNDLRITANREELDYQADVIKKITDRFTDVVDSVKKTVSTRVSTAPNLATACAWWHKAKSEFTFVLLTGEWNGIKLFDDIPFSTYGSTWDGVKIHNFKRTAGEQRDRYQSTKHIRFQEDHLLALNDATVIPSMPRIATLFDQYPHVETIDVITFSDKAKEPGQLKMLEDKYHWSKLDPIKLSTVAKKPSVHQHSAGSGVKIVGTRILDNNGNWQDTDVDFETDSGLYVILHAQRVYLDIGFDPVTKRADTDGHNDVSINNLTTIAHEYNLKVYGFLSRYIPKLGPNWTPFKQKVEELAAAQAKKPLVMKSIHEREFINDTPTPWRIMKDPLWQAKIVNKNSVCLRYIRIHAKYSRAAEKLHKLCALYSFLGRSIPSNSSKSKLSILLKKFNKLYPLAHAIDGYRYNHDLSDIENDFAIYVNTKDAMATQIATTPAVASTTPAEGATS